MEYSMINDCFISLDDYKFMPQKDGINPFITAKTFHEDIWLLWLANSRDEALEAYKTLLTIEI
jgi:hypothetical protein